MRTLAKLYSILNDLTGRGSDNKPWNYTPVDSWIEYLFDFEPIDMLLDM